MAVTLPADMLSFYGYSARMTAAIAYLRGYDIESEEVRSVILISLLGAAGVGALGEAGVQAGTRAAMAALRGLPGTALTRINQRVGFRLVTKFGTKGVVNLYKAIPVLGGGVGAGINVIARYAKANFPPIAEP